MAKKGNGNNNNTQVIRVSDKTREKLIKYYEDKKRDKVIPYVVFQAQDADTVVTLYESGKVMFQGVSADIDANMWRDIDGQEKVDKVKLKADEIMTIGYIKKKGTIISELGQKYIEEISKYKDRVLD